MCVRTFAAAMLVGCVFLAFGCSVIRVTHEPISGVKTKKLDGVPFYSMSARCKHETVWTEPTYQVSLARTGQVKVGNEVKQFVQPVGTRLISWSQYKSEKFQTLLRLFETITSTQRDDQVLQAFRQLEPYALPIAGLPEPQNRFLASNQMGSDAFVDYADVHYYNARRPILGTVNAQFELSPNGTLAKGSAQIESKTLQAFLDLIPVKDVVSTAAKAALATGLEAPPQEIPVVLTLTIEPQVYRHTLSKTTAISSDCGTPGAPLGSDAKFKIDDVNYSRALAGSEESKKKGEEGKKVKFSGDVEIPK